MHDIRLRSITNAIRTRRELLNYSQEYMACRMEIGQNCYSKIELGHTRLTLDRLFYICEILDTDIKELIGIRQPIRGQASGF